MPVNTTLPFILLVAIGVVSALVPNTTTTNPTSPGSTSAAAGGDDLANFGDTLQIGGNMDRTDIDFVDGFAVDLLSPKNRTFVVAQNNQPLDGKFVSGTTGENFQAILPYSYVIKLNEPADDLISKVELPYEPTKLESAGFDPADTYVGKLAPDGKSWMIMENQRNIHKSENKTRIIKKTTLEGEYLLLGRRDIDSSNIFVQYGQGETRTANFTGGPGVQEAEFIDGLRFSVEADQPVRMNVEIKSLIDSSMLPQGMQPLNSFAYVINTTSAAPVGQPAVVPPASLAPASETPDSTSAPTGTTTASAAAAASTITEAAASSRAPVQAAKRQQAPSLRNATISFPVNAALLRNVAASLTTESGKSKSKAIDFGNVRFMIGRRAVGASTAPFQPMSAGSSTGLVDGEVQLKGLTQLDGEYAVLVSMGDEQGQGDGRETASVINSAGSLSQAVPGVLAFAASMLLSTLSLNVKETLGTALLN